MVFVITFDIVIKNGRIVDGTGKKSYLADIGIKGDKIALIGKIDADAPSIDASGCYVTPGFIDPHSHADASLFLYPDCESYLRQGITTFIGGQCGDANAPIYNWWMRKYWEYCVWDDIDPFVWVPKTVQPAARVVDVVRERFGYDIQWRSLSEYAKVVENLGLGCNMIMLAGHSQIRADVMCDDSRRPEDSEMRMMKAHLDDAFAAGAWGFSTGRDYPPSYYADTDEIMELARHTLAHDGCYFTHWKRTGHRVGVPKRPNKLEGIVEALDISLLAGIKTQISHLTTGYEIYPEDSRMDVLAAELTLLKIDEYRERGADAAFDVIPGTSGGIAINPYLASLLMPWVKQSGSLGQFVTNLKARDYRASIISTLGGGGWYAINPIVNPSWDKKIFIIVGPDGTMGRSIREIADERRMDALEAMVDILMETPRTTIEKRDKSEEEIRALLNHPMCFVCTDTYAFDIRGPYGNDAELPEILPHPHTYCAFPKYILDCCGREPIETTVRRITGAPSEFMGIRGRGTIKEGWSADLVIFNVKELATNESYIEPRAWPGGVRFVIVNGEPVVTPDGFTGKRAGMILKK